MMDALLWFSLAFLAYTYVGYPLLIGALARLRPRVGCQEPNVGEDWPEVSVIVPAHNEARHVQRKIESLRAAHYPQEKLRILFVSDGSTDGTVELLQARGDVELIVSEVRRGKPSAINQAMARVQTPIVVFTDARQTIAPDAIAQLVACLRDPTVGVASGELVIRDARSGEARSAGLYWAYERWIRKAESAVHSTAGATGALYAMRTRDFVALPADTVLDDVAIPMQVLREGRRIVLRSGAEVYDTLPEDVAGEKRRKIRTLAGNFQFMARNPWTLDPLRNPIWWQFVSHKLFRLLAPYFMVLLLVASLFPTGPWGALLLAGQLAFYGLALLAKLDARFRSFNLANFALVFVELNVAAVVGLKRYVTDGLDVCWERGR